MDDTTSSNEALLKEIQQLRRQNSELEDKLAERSDAVAELRSVLSSVPVLVCVAGLDGYYRRVNKAFETILGYTEKESLAKPFLEFIHFDDREKAQIHLAKLADGECLVDFEDRNICRDGSYRWISWTVVPFPEKGLVYGVGHDITVQKHAVTTLRESETRFRSVYESGMIGIAFWDAVGIIRVANDAYLRMTGITRQELLSAPVNREEHRCGSCRDDTQRICEPIEKEFTHKDGTRVFALVGSAALRGEHYDGVTFCIDITERKQSEAALRRAHNDLERRVEERTAELAAANEQLNREILERSQTQETLRESEERFRALVETTSDMIFEVDINGMYTYVSPRIKMLLGFDPEEFIGRNIVDFVPPKQAPQLRSLLKGGDSVPAVEVTRYRKDGQVTVSELSAVPILDANGKCIGYRGVSRDITQRKKAEQQLKREHQVLTRLLTEHDRERQMISYEIHDGLAQTLAGAIMQFQAFCGQLGDLPEATSTVRDNVQQLLDGSLAEARRLISGVRPPILDDSGVLAAIQDLIVTSNSQEGPVCEFDCDVAFKRLDPVLEITVYRIAQEGLANARQHSQSERVRLRISQRDKIIRVEIQDWGVGFDPHTVDERQFGLLGIRERASLLGGSAEILSGPGQGTSVIAELPLKLD